MKKTGKRTKAIITFGVGYDFSHIQPFIQSCSLFVPDADIYLFVGRNIDVLREQCRIYPAVKLIRYREQLLAKVISRLMIRSPFAVRYVKFLRQARQQHILSDKIAEALTVPLVQFMVKRFFLVRALLADVDHERIMLTDIRDVILQSDPFKDIGTNTLVTGIEPLTNAESEINKAWITKTYSEETFEKLKYHFVVCAGVTIGSRTTINQYISEMIDEVYNNLPKIIDMLGADQAIHINLFYRKLHGINKHLEENGIGSIATLHFSTLSEFALADGKISNLHNDDLAVVHQYDRHPHLADVLIDGIKRTYQSQP